MDLTERLERIDEAMERDRFDEAMDQAHEILFEDPENPQARLRVRQIQALNRRQTRRYDERFEVEILRKSGRDVVATVLDISRGGLRATVQKWLAEGETVKVRFPQVAADFSLKPVPSEIVWARREEGERRVGVRFQLSDDGAQDLIKYLLARSTVSG